MPSIVDDLLDINQWPCKPQYNIVSELPLILFDSQYKNVNWICEKSDHEKIIKSFQDIWLNHQMKTTMLKRMIDHLEIDYNERKDLNDDLKKIKCDNIRNMNQPYVPLQGKTISLNYIKLENRRTAKSLENRVDFYIKKNKIEKEFVDEKIAFSKNFLDKKLL